MASRKHYNAGNKARFDRLTRRGYTACTRACIAGFTAGLRRANKVRLDQAIDYNDLTFDDRQSPYSRK